MLDWYEDTFEIILKELWFNWFSSRHDLYDMMKLGVIELSNHVCQAFWSVWCWNEIFSSLLRTRDTGHETPLTSVLTCHTHWCLIAAMLRCDANVFNTRSNTCVLLINTIELGRGSKIRVRSTGVYFSKNIIDSFLRGAHHGFKRFLTRERIWKKWELFRYFTQNRSKIVKFSIIFHENIKMINIHWWIEVLEQCNKLNKYSLTEDLIHNLNIFAAHLRYPQNLLLKHCSDQTVKNARVRHLYRMCWEDEWSLHEWCLAPGDEVSWDPINNATQWHLEAFQ